MPAATPVAVVQQRWDVHSHQSIDVVEHLAGEHFVEVGGLYDSIATPHVIYPSDFGHSSAHLEEVVPHDIGY